MKMTRQDERSGRDKNFPMKLKTLLLAVLTASTALAANSVPLFNALLTVGKEQRFVLVTVDGQTSSWLKLGDSYAGFTIKAYDPAAATLALERDGKIVNAQLVGGAGVKDAPAAALPATLADAEEVLRGDAFRRYADQDHGSAEKNGFADDATIRGPDEDTG